MLPLSRVVKRMIRASTLMAEVDFGHPSLMGVRRSAGGRYGGCEIGQICCRQW